MKCVFVFLNDFFKKSLVQALALRAERGIDVEAAVDAHFLAGLTTKAYGVGAGNEGNRSGLKEVTMTINHVKQACRF